jgi:predicted nucleic acid-binding protein
LSAFLLDSNILFHMLDARRSGHTAAWNHLHALPSGSHIAISAIALAESDVGCCLGTRDLATARTEIAELVRHNGFFIEPVTQHTAPFYGELKAKLFKRFQPKRARWPEKWKDKPTGADIGVEEPDLIMAAQALEHGYVLVTGDSMDNIQTVLKAESMALTFVDWTKP